MFQNNKTTEQLQSSALVSALRENPGSRAGVVFKRTKFSRDRTGDGRCEGSQEGLTMPADAIRSRLPPPFVRGLGHREKAWAYFRDRCCAGRGLLGVRGSGAAELCPLEHHPRSRTWILT